MGVSAHNPGTVVGVTARTFKTDLCWKGKANNKVRQNRDPKIQRTQQLDQRENVSDKITAVIVQNPALSQIANAVVSISKNGRWLFTKIATKETYAALVPNNTNSAIPNLPLSPTDTPR